MKLRVLHVEDNPMDVKLLDRELMKSGFEVVSNRVQAAETLRAVLREQTFDIILSDYSMPSFTGIEALQIVQDSGLDIPFILVSGSVGEEKAIDALERGASNFVFKQNLARLAPAVAREIKDAQTRRERAAAFVALEEALKSRDEFLSIASHELKTPLAALHLQLQGLLRKLLKADKADELLGQIHARIEAADRSAQRLAKLVERLLDINRLTSGRLELVAKPLDLGQLVSKCVDALADLAGQSGSRVDLHLSGQVEGLWDRDHLVSVVDNLLENAVKYGGGKPIRVDVRPDGPYAVLVVRDEGIGIAPGDQRRIFERFERAVPLQHYGGFGLGLWLTRRIVEAHGGTIGVESAAGRGSTFTVRLPRAIP